MPINFDHEINEITENLKKVEGYLECEKIIIHNLKKLLDQGFDEESIKYYLTQLSKYLENRIEHEQNNIDCTNYRYATSFVNTLLKMPFWKSWMQTIDF